MLRRVQTIADYQFGKGTGVEVFPDECRFITSRRGGVRQVLFRDRRLATLRAHDGRLTLGYAGAERLHDYLPSPLYRVYVREDVTGFIAAGKSVFSKHVISSDKGIRSGDDVLVVNSDDHLLAVGSALLSGEEMVAFKYGAAVQVRKGRDQEDIS